jgi:16S rRNA (guanine1207-N2)-methyltransferase
MSRDTQRTLFYPYETGDIACPAVGQSLVFIGAEPGFHLPEGFGAQLLLVQGFRPYFSALLASRYKVVPRPEGEDYDGALVLTSRHRGQNQARISAAIDRTRPGGQIVVAGSTDDGVASLRKRLELLVGLDGHLPKYHGQAVWFRRPVDATAVHAGLANEASLAGGRFVAAPGMFSHDRIDSGSLLLAGHLPDNWKGAAADFGAGWGYLATILAERTHGLKSIDLYEADFESLEAAKTNLASVKGAPATDFLWHDLVNEKVDRKYDLIVMNPPFHQGRAAEPAIGQAMIHTASASLRPGGRLFMVQNRGLPYDQVLKARFSRVSEIQREGAFRVIVAER